MARNDKDLTEKLLEDYNDVFADIVNGLLFGGQKVVGENELIPATPYSVYKADGKLHEQERDTAKYWIKGKAEIALYGLENQTREDPDMTLRLISYDGAGYRAQMLRDPKDEKGRRIRRNPRYPVITLVLYYGTQRWKSSANLKDNLEMPEELDRYVNDYKMNLFEIAYLTEEQISCFHSDFKQVADFFVHRRTDPDYRGTKDTIRHVDAVLKLLSALTGDNRFEDGWIKNERRPSSMYDMIDRWLDQGAKKGIDKTKKEVAERMIRAGKYADNEIADISGLTLEQVQELRREKTVTA